MMSHRPIAIITEESSDLLETLKLANIPIALCKPGGIDRQVLESSTAIAILGGTSDKPLLFHPRERLLIEEQLAKGKKVFSEFCESIGNVYCAPPASTRYDRIVFCGNVPIEGLETGELLDEQCNTRIAPFEFGCTTKRPIFQYVQVAAHRKVAIDEEWLNKNENRAIWLDEPETLLICSFRLANFVKARFAPLRKWRAVVKYLLEWLCEREINVDALEDAYRTRGPGSGETPEAELAECVRSAISWFTNAGMLLAEGKDGVREGLGTEIYPDGTQRVANYIRNDCIGETAFAYFMNYLWTGDHSHLAISDRMLEGAFDWFVIKDQSHLTGMMRWTEAAWGTNYQDDAARVIIPQLLKNLYSGRDDHQAECMAVLDFMLRTTGTDGTRVFRTDNASLTEERIAALSSTPGDLPSAHYNGYYMAALLLAYQQTGKARYREAAVRGMETIMSVYPHTTREQSQTQELCRLILPLSWLYWITGRSEHKAWLYQVVSDLQAFRHPTGGYTEWDEGYRAAMYGTKPGEESSILTNNGDPVVDLLYSVNWLPVSFMQAYFVTGDPYFKRLWEEVAHFMVASQIVSDNPTINGGWSRAFDVEKWEVFGYPGDGGWGPWAIESGWTVAEITSGLIMGLLERQLAPFYDQKLGV